jgi:DNA-binding MarR family transcriptional regulator
VFYLCKLTDVPDYATSPGVVGAVERIVVASVGLTARSLADVVPELTLAQWRVLVLVDRPGGMAIGSIASALGAKIAAASRLVGRLHARDLVESKRSDVDARVVLVSLTKAGEDLRTRVLERRRAELVARLSAVALPTEALDLVERLATAREVGA